VSRLAVRGHGGLAEGIEGIEGRLRLAFKRAAEDGFLEATDLLVVNRRLSDLMMMMTRHCCRIHRVFFCRCVSPLYFLFTSDLSAVVICSSACILVMYSAVAGTNSCSAVFFAVESAASVLS